jgi:hypothetical protein
MAQSSHATWGDMPRTCAGCGHKLRISGKDGPLWLDTYNRESWHFACKRTRLRNKPTNTPAIHVRISSEGVRVNVEGDHDQALELTRLLDQRPDLERFAQMAVLLAEDPA